MSLNLITLGWALLMLPSILEAAAPAKFSDLKNMTLQLAEINVPTATTKDSRFHCSSTALLGKEYPLYSGRFVQLNENRMGYSPHRGSMSIFGQRELSPQQMCESSDANYNAVTMVGLDFSKNTIDFEVLGANFQKREWGGSSIDKLISMACPLESANVVNKMKFSTTCVYRPIVERSKTTKRLEAVLNFLGLGSDSLNSASDALPSLEAMAKSQTTADEAIGIYALGDDSKSIPRIGWVDCRDPSNGALFRYLVLKTQPKGGFAACR